MIEEYCKERELPVVGRIPFDPEAVKAIKNGQSIVDIDCTSGIAVKEIYQKIMDLLEL